MLWQTGHVKHCSIRIFNKIFKEMKLMFYFLLFHSLLLSCASTAAQQDPIPLHDTLKIVSAHLEETRTINVWTPPGYAASADSLPVLYMPDGGVHEDFPHIANTLAELLAAKKIPPFILAGIENTQRRRDLTGPTKVAKDKEIAPVVGESEKFLLFIQDELIPEINKRYRTTSTKGIIGESLAGLFVTETFLLHPESFDIYIAFDPSLWWNDKYLLANEATQLAKFPNAPKRFWFAGSGAKDISATVGKFAKTLETAAPGTLQWKYVPSPKEKHNTIFRARKEEALIWALNGQ